MGSSQRLAAVAAASHARQHYNHTPADGLAQELPHYSVNILFVSATLCGVLVAVCAACWKRSPADNKPDDCAGAGVYTVSADAALTHVPEEIHGPPPPYETVVHDPALPKDCSLQEVISEPCPRCTRDVRPDSGLPSYEAAVLLRDTRL